MPGRGSDCTPAATKAAPAIFFQVETMRDEQELWEAAAPLDRVLSSYRGESAIRHHHF